MMKLFKLLTATLVLTTASQSYSMVRSLSRFSSVRAASSSVLSRLLAPTGLAKRLATQPALKQAVSIQKNMQPTRFLVTASNKQHNNNQNNYGAFPQYSRARTLLAGLLGSSAAGLALFGHSAQAEGAAKSDDREKIINEALEKEIADLQKQIATKEDSMLPIKRKINSLKHELLCKNREIRIFELKKLLKIEHSAKVLQHSRMTHVTLIEFLEGSKDCNSYFFNLEGGFEGMLSIYKAAHPYLVGERIETLAREIRSLNGEIGLTAYKMKPSDHPVLWDGKSEFRK